MVKEVEIRPINFSDIIGQYYGYTTRSSYENPTMQKASGVLSDEGKTLDITLNLNATSKEFTSNIFLLDYNSIDYSNRVITDTAITDIIVRTSDTLDLTYTDIDLSQVLEIPQIATVQTIDQSLSIDLFTYEANVVEEYGTKRLSVPYKVSNDPNLTFNTSTDGLYTIHYANVRQWNSTSQYVQGQITVYNNTAYVCNVANTNQLLGNSYYWSIATEEDIREFTNGNTTGRENDSLITAQFGILITRDFKQTLLYDVLSATSFRTDDDDTALELLYLI